MTNNKTFSAPVKKVLLGAIADAGKVQTANDEKAKAAAALKDRIATLQEKHGWQAADVDSGGTGGKQRPVGKYYPLVVDLVAATILPKSEYAIIQSGETGRGTEGATIKRKVANRVRTLLAPFNPSEPKALDEVLRDFLANGRTKIIGAMRADTDKREKALEELAGQEKEWLAVFDAAIAASPKK